MYRLKGIPQRIAPNCQNLLITGIVTFDVPFVTDAQAGRLVCLNVELQAD